MQRVVGELLRRAREDAARHLSAEVLLPGGEVVVLSHARGLEIGHEALLVGLAALPMPRFAEREALGIVRS